MTISDSESMVVDVVSDLPCTPEEQRSVPDSEPMVTIPDSEPMVINVVCDLPCTPEEQRTIPDFEPMVTIPDSEPMVINVVCALPCTLEEQRTIPDFKPMETIPDSESMVTIPDSEPMVANVVCTPEEERRIVTELKEEAEANEKDGNLYFLISLGSHSWLPLDFFCIAISCYLVQSRIPD